MLRPEIAQHSSEPTEQEHQIGRVSVAEISVPGGHAIPTHAHEEPSICVITAGGFDERHQRGEQACLPGTLRSSPADDKHRIGMRDAPMRCIVIALEREEVPLAGGRLYVRSPVLAKIAARLARVAAEPARNCPLRAESMALELFAGMLRHERPRRYRHPPLWLSDIRRTLADPASWSLTIDELGLLCGHNGAHLAFAFREHFGLTIGEYVRERQISVARELLMNTTTPISQVAASAGFSDQSHLTRVMRRTLGITPARLRA